MRREGVEGLKGELIGGRVKTSRERVGGIYQQGRKRY